MRGHVGVAGLLATVAVAMRLGTHPGPDALQQTRLPARLEATQLLASHFEAALASAKPAEALEAVRQEALTLLLQLEAVPGPAATAGSPEAALRMAAAAGHLPTAGAPLETQALGVSRLIREVSALLAGRVVAQEAALTAQRAHAQALMDASLGCLACALVLLLLYAWRDARRNGPLDRATTRFLYDGGREPELVVPPNGARATAFETAWNKLVSHNLLTDAERRAEALATAAAEGMAEILERMRQAVVVFDADGRVTAVNRGAAMLLDRRRQEILGANLFQLVTQSGNAALQAVIRSLEIHGVVAGAQLQLARADGTAIPVELSGGILREPESGTSRYFLVAEDVTEKARLRERIEEKVEELEWQVAERTRELQIERNKLTAFLDQAPDMMFELDARVCVSWANAAAMRELADAGDGLLGLAAAKLVSSEDRSRVVEEFERLLAQGVLVTRMDLVGMSGRRVPVEVAATLVKNEAGEPCGARVVARSLAERTEAERRQQLLLAAMEGTQDGVVISDLNGSIMHVNGAAARMSAATPESLVGKPVSALSGARAEGNDAEQRHLSQVLIQGLANGESVRWPEPGVSVPVSINSALIRDSHRVPLAIVTIQRDLSEDRARRDREAAYRDSLMRSEKLSALGQLIAGVAHELNNPLAAVIGFAQLLGMGDIPDQARGDLTQLLAAAERSRRIVTNLLTFARRHRPERNATLLSQVVKDSVALVEYEFRVNNVDIELCLVPDAVPLMLDGHQVQQVLINLLKNSEHAIREHGERGVIRISTQYSDKEATLTFEDDGPGIPPDIQNKVFDPFFTTKDVGKGTGLGLSISYGIIQEHCGQIRLEKGSLRGACFVLSFPVGEVMESSPAGEEPPAELPITGRRLLVVDDEESIRVVVKRLMSLGNHQVDLASSGRQALTLLSQQSYDCVLCDQHMPGMTGTEMFQELWTRQPGMRSRCILVTGDTVDPDAQGFAEQNGVRFHPKPFDLAALDATVQEVLRANPEVETGSRP